MFCLSCAAAIIWREFLPPDVYKIYTLTTDRLALITNTAHPLARAAHVTPDQIKNERFMFMQPQTYIGQIAGDVCREHGFEPILLQRARVETILSNVASGRCVSLLTEKLLDVFRVDEICAVPLYPEIRFHIVIAVPPKAHRKPIVRSLVRHLTAHAAGPAVE